MNKLFELLDNRVDAVLITSDINRRYFTGLKSTAGICLITKEKKYLLVDFRYYEKALKTVNGFEIIELKKRKEQLSKLFNENNIKVVAVEGDTLTLSEYNKLQEDFSETEFETKSLSNAISLIRSIKTNDEVENIIKAQRIAEKAFEKTLSEIKIGMTEKFIADMLDNNMKMLGSEGVSFDTIVLSGVNSAMPHGEPSDKKIEEGEFLLFDFGAVYKGYHSDMTRTVALGYVTEEMQQVYDIVLAAQETAITKAKAGMTGSELDSVARDIITENGYCDNFGHSLGHSVGLEIHEYPNCSPSFDKKLENGIIMTIEPGIYLPNKFGVRIEDMILITENGCENLTKCEKSLRIIK